MSSVDAIKAERICIIGGGSAGYMAAAYLLNQTNFDVTMVVPKKNNPIGVGEATLLGFIDFMGKCGMPYEIEWMHECDAIYKCGILYTDWREDGKDVWHPFAQFHENFFKEYANKGYSYDSFIKKILPHHRLLTEELNVTVARGYHLDAKKFVDFLDKKLDESNLTKIRKTISDVTEENGLIKSVTFDDGTSEEYDLFIDCTGFNSPFKEYGSTEFVDLSDYFTGNAACACPIKYSEDEETKREQMMAVTNPKGSDLGWIWNTPVSTRIGTGLVYNSECNTREEAEAEMIRVYGEENIIGEFNHINYTPGYHKKSWRGNVCSIGLSSGFIEPLESTGIDIFQAQIMTLTDYIKKGFASENDRIRYNSTIANRYEEGTDYVTGHYYPPSIWRSSPFWEKTKNNKVSETLMIRYEKYQRDKMMFGNSICDTCMFGHQSWATLFEGFFPDGMYSGDKEITININDAEDAYAHSNLDILQYIPKEYDNFIELVKDRLGEKNYE